MNAEEIKKVIESRGYTNVTVKGFSKSCRLHYQTMITSETMNLYVPLSDITMSWLNNHFEPLLTATTLTFANEEMKK